MPTLREQVECRKVRGEIRRLLESKQLVGRLEDLDLSGLDMRGFEFKDAILVDVNLSGTDLSFSHGDVVCQRVNLEKSKLIGANVPGIHLEKTNLRGADLSLGNFSDGSADGCTFRSILYAGASFRGFRFVGKRSLWAAADLRGSANMEGGDFHRAGPFTESHDLIAHVMRRASEECGIEDYFTLGNLVQGVPRTREFCWSHILDVAGRILSDGKLEELLRFAVREYPHAWFDRRWELEMKKRTKLSQGENGIWMVEYPRGILEIREDGLIQPQGAVENVENIDGMLVDVFGEN